MSKTICLDDITKTLGEWFNDCHIDESINKDLMSKLFDVYCQAIKEEENNKNEN